MYIGHIAIWVSNLENSKKFFEDFFNGKSNNKYINEKTNLQSYFMKFETGPDLEIMSIPTISTNTSDIMGIVI